MSNSPANHRSDYVGDEERSIGEAIRKWRMRSNQTLAQLAEATDLSIGYVSQIERGMANPSLSVLKRFAEATDTTVGDLLAGSQRFNNEAPARVVRAGSRTEVKRPDQPFSMELLSPDLQGELEVVLVSVDPEVSSGVRAHDHDGEECLIVLEGSMHIWAGDMEFDLDAGDSLYLRARVPHRWHNSGTTRLRVVFARTPPTL